MTDRQTINYGIEALRIVSMLMVVMFHLIVHCNLAGNINPLSITYEMDRFFNAACHVAVNCFSLITGYVWINSKWNVGKIVKYWMIAFVYSVGLNGIIFVFDRFLFTPKELLLCVFPVFSKYQWYLTAYVFLFFCIPILKIVMDSLSKKQIEMFLMVILLLTTIVPIVLCIDTFSINYGYSVWWMGILFIVGNYVAKYNPFKQIKKIMVVVVFGFYYNNLGMWISC